MTTQTFTPHENTIHFLFPSPAEAFREDGGSGEKSPGANTETPAGVHFPAWCVSLWLSPSMGM